jgi:hypothetical protein
MIFIKIPTFSVTAFGSPSISSGILALTFSLRFTWKKSA